MEQFRLKNIIILILLLVNVALLCSLGLQWSEQCSAEARLQSELTALFAAADLPLETDSIPTDTPPDSLSLTRSAQQDRALATFFLGDALETEDEGGGLCTYRSGTGQASFRANGSFEITGALPDGDPLELCRKFAEEFGCTAPESTLTGSSGTITAGLSFDGFSVVDTRVIFAVEAGQLHAVTGTYLPRDSASTVDSPTMLAATALNRFLEYRRKSGDAFSSVSDVYLCYELQSTTASPMLLTPVWCVVTDIANYYVNCSTGEVTRG